LFQETWGQIHRFWAVWWTGPVQRVGLVVVLGLGMLFALSTRAARVQLKYEKFTGRKTMGLTEIHPLPRVGCRPIHPKSFEKCVGQDRVYYNGTNCVETRDCLEEELDEYLFSSVELCRTECLIEGKRAPSVLDFFALGHPQFLSDLLFIKAQMYFVQHLFTDRLLGSVFDEYVSAIIALDPLNREIYKWAAERVKYGQIINRDVIHKANHYARLGLRHFPDDPDLYLEIGFNLHPDLGQYQPEDKHEYEQNRKEGLDYLILAVSLPGACLDPNTIVELVNRSKNVELARQLAAELYFGECVLDTQRASLRGRLMNLNMPMAERLHRLEKQWKEHFPYVPFRLLSLLGKPIWSNKDQGEGGS
jgi:hypothetical protein